MAIPASLLFFRHTTASEQMSCAATALTRTSGVGEVRATATRCRTMLCDERASWLKEGRAFRIMASRPQAKAG